MTLHQLEAYLDGELAAAEREAIERAIATDTDVVRRLAALKSERALRQAAYATYLPDAATARAEAQAILAKCFAEDAPAVAGRIGWTWTKRIAAVAAMLVIAAGSFYMGRTTIAPANPQVAIQPEKTTPEQAALVKYVVVVPRGMDAVEPAEFSSLAEAREYAEKLSVEQQATGSDDMILAGVL